MSEVRYLIARNDWHASQFMKKVYNGRVLNPDSFLFHKQVEASNKIKTMPFSRQEEYSIFKVNFDRNKIIKT